MQEESVKGIAKKSLKQKERINYILR